jgi:hypothetical protein
MKPKENHRTTAQVIAQVEGEFRARGYGVTLSKNTIIRCVAHGMLGTFLLVRGYEGMMPKHSFQLLVLAVESFIQISNVNSINAKRLTLMMAANTYCGVAPAEILYQHFTEAGAEEVGIVLAPWTEIDEAELIALRDGP